MRKKFSEYFKNEIKKNSNLIVLLGDISVGLFLDSEDNLHPNVYNLGILEQSMLSFASGLAANGKTPIVHTISPFLVERAYEQIKLSCGYNKSKVVIISANGPFDYGKLGPTHHCVNDVVLLSLIENVEIFIPGRIVDLNKIFSEVLYELDISSYIRLTERSTDIEMKEVNNYTYEHNLNSFNNKKAVLLIGEALQLYKKFEEKYNVYYSYSPSKIDSSIFEKYNELNVFEPYSNSLIKDRFKSIKNSNFNTYNINFKRECSNQLGFEDYKTI